MVDSVTKERDKLSFPRVLVEVSMNQEFADIVEFEDEYGNNVEVVIKYEWKPLKCNHCFGLGHSTDECKKKSGSKKEWIIKATGDKRDNGARLTEKQQGKKPAETDAEGFKPAGKKWKVKEKPAGVSTELGNTFQVLAEASTSYCDLVESEIVGQRTDLDKQMDDQSLVKQFIALQRIGLVGLLETRVKASKLGALYLRVFNGWCFTSNVAWHPGGRIVLAWNPQCYHVNIIKCDSQFIHSKVATADGRNEFYVTYVYALNDKEGRRKLWMDLKELSTCDPWIVLGDFNEILNREERVGDRVHYHKATEFIEVVEKCQLEDVKMSGNFFTWNNKQHGADRIYSKIDRILANPSWMGKYSNAEALFLNQGVFDHSPGVLNFHSEVSNGKKPFKYFRMWSSYPTYTEKIKDVWAQPINGTKMYQVVTRLKAMKGVLKEINKQGFSELHVAEAKAKEELEVCQSKLQLEPHSLLLHQEELKARLHYLKVHSDLSSMLQQKAKVSWVKNGDDNTLIFHSSLRERRRQNKILSIEQLDGTRTEQPEQVTEAFISYYKMLLGSSMENRKKVISSVVNLGPKVTKQQAEMLMGKYSKDECKAALFAIPGIKAPGRILKEINSTVLTLIPKVKCPNTVKDFRPIACCNVVYKVATKMICARLKNILPSLIAQNQSGFVKGRLIAHNVMVCQDLIRHYGRKNAKANCMIKLDLQKAYDTVEWDFIEEMMEALQFPSQFIQLVMNCGDPMSLIFVLGMEYLSKIMQRIGSKEEFRFHERCEEIKLNHLSFADDVLLFSKGDFKSVYLMLQGLKLFSLSSDMSGFGRHYAPFRYLGVPICAKRISSTDCKELAEKMTSRIKVWSTRNLSFAGRAVLVNSVLMTIHSYWSQIMILPKKTVNEIEAICRAFLWKGQHAMTSPGLIAWNSVCQAKSEGGIGFRKVEEWNRASMFKYVWAIANKEDNMWVRWIHNVYIREDDWWGYNAPVQGSWYWKKIVEAKNQIATMVDVQQFTHSRYHLSLGYKLLVPPQLKMHWSKEVWGKFNIPKCSFILWIAIQGRLRTRERLHRFGIINDSGCVLCNAQEETCDHLFFSCSFSQHCLQMIKDWLGWKVSTQTLSRLLRWIERSKYSKFKKNTLSAVMASLVYLIWRARNDKIWNGKDEDVNRDFAVYAETCFEKFGEKVKHWITFNEPHIFSTQGYDLGLEAPGRCTFCKAGSSATEPYIVAHNLLLSHATAANIYTKNYKPKQKGSIGISLDVTWYEPASNSTADVEATKRAQDFQLGWFLDPLVFGDYPKSMKERVKKRLPVFSKFEASLVKGSLDFVGINHYTTYYAWNRTVALNDTLQDSGALTIRK
uniref:Reverse transcriptase domain-containing protein n=1 Tax=Cannabis sativa TaxID=3483 RepID=A0A803QPV1_CANSA